MTVARGGAVERLVRVETKLEGIEAAVAESKAAFGLVRQTLDAHAAESRKSIEELKTMVADTHAACVKPADLKDITDRIGPLETFRDRVKRYGWIGGAMASVAVGSLVLFGPTKVGAAVEAAVSKLFG